MAPVAPDDRGPRLKTGHVTHDDVSVIVCAYTPERWDDIVAAIRSVRSQDLAPRQIILVVDHAPELFARARASFPDVTVIENGHRPGLPGARNTGIQVAEGRIIVFLDDDARAEPGWLRTMASAFEDDHVLGVGGTILPIWSNGRPRWFPDEFLWVVGCTYRGMPDARAPVRNMIGASMALRRSVFEDVGGFREELGRIGSRPVGCEETELCIRASRRWPTGVFLHEPSAVVLHRQPPSRGTWRYFLARCYAEGLSKAVVSRLAGPSDALASERRYATRVLPAGAFRGLRDALVGRDPSGLGRTAAIVAGLGATTAGYVIGLASGRRSA